jgi:hypothetical protein
MNLTHKISATTLRWLFLLTLLMLGFSKPRASAASAALAPIKDVSLSLVDLVDSSQTANSPSFITACPNAAGGAPPCKDGDHDGLCDSWERAQRLPTGAPLPGAHPDKPDIYVQYDWMDYGPSEKACNSTGDCTAVAGQAGFTCTGPALTAGFIGSCVHACEVDIDCTSLGPSHVADRCGIADGVRQCLHSNDPVLLVPDGSGGSAALDAVVKSFADHQTYLHILRGHPLPHSHVLSFRTLAGLTPMTDACEGGSLASGNAGAGKYVESFYDLKAGSFDQRLSLVYHYMIFADYSSCDSTGHCAACPVGQNPDGSTKITSLPKFQQSGVSEYFGNDFIVSLANYINEVGNPPDVFNIGGTFMHELGHNLGLHHGGGFDSNGTAEDVGVEFKPNYLSVMNYNYQFVGIPQLNGPSRLDYSTQVLPTGGPTPGVLYENNLDETAGLGSGDHNGAFFYTDASCNFRVGPTDGAVDWDGDLIAGDNTSVSADLHPSDHPGACGVINDIPLRGHLDWPPGLPGPLFTYRFQCTSMGGD